jgi:hypothetical protein
MGAILSPFTQTPCNLKSSSSFTRQARAPGSIRPTSRKPRYSACRAEVISAACLRLNPRLIRFRNASSIVIARASKSCPVLQRNALALLDQTTATPLKSSVWHSRRGRVGNGVKARNRTIGRHEHGGVDMHQISDDFREAAFGEGIGGYAGGTMLKERCSKNDAPSGTSH